MVVAVKQLVDKPISQDQDTYGTIMCRLDYALPLEFISFFFACISCPTYRNDRHLCAREDCVEWERNVIDIP